MKIQDLRVGNYVSVDEKIDKITLIGFDFVQFKTFNTHLKNIKPLRITKELLESVGFKWSKGFETFFNKEYGHIQVNIFGSIWHYSIDYGVKPTKLKGFHHLQNIIYDLFETELSIAEKIK